MRVDSGAPTATTTHDGGVTEKRRSRTRSQSGSRSSGSGSGSASANGKTGEFASLPSPRSSPPSPPLFVVPISREDDVESCGVVEVAFSGGRRTWTIGDLKLALKPVTALGVHEQVILFADHQLTDGIKVSREILDVILENGGLVLRRRDQKCGPKRLFSTGIRSLSTFITRNFTNPLVLQQQQELRDKAAASQQQQHQQTESLSPPLPPPPPPPMPAPSTMHNDDDYSSILSSEDMDSDLDSSNTSFELTIDGAVDYATELHNERTASVYTPSEYDYRHGIKRSWEEEDDDLDATGISHSEQVVYHSTGEYLAVQAPEGILSPPSDSIPSLATGNVYLDAALDAESARSIHQVLGGIGLASSAAEGCTPFLHNAGIINDIDEDFDADDDDDDAMSVLGSAAAIVESCDLPRKRVRAI